LELIKDLKMISPNTASIVLSMHDEMLYAERALRAGARGYVMKLEDTATVIRAIREALAGKVFVSSKISECLLMKFSGGMKKCVASVDQLSDRELDVLQLIGGGLGTPEIARQLHLSPKTVTVHKGRIKEKLALKTATEMIRFAVAWVDSSQKAAI
jgi:DNA-binding NarL/FixJ family response regulator